MLIHFVPHIILMLKKHWNSRSKRILIIDEVAAVSLDFRHTTQRTLDNHMNSLKNLIKRDKNHPSVIAWALGNEPNLAGEVEYRDGRGEKILERNFWFA